MSLEKKSVIEIAELYSIEVLFSNNGGKPQEVNHEESIELLATYRTGIIPEEDAYKWFFRKQGSGRVVHVNYVRCNGDVEQISFARYLREGRPRRMKVTTSKQISFSSH